MDLVIQSCIQNHLRFDGATFKTEQSSRYTHAGVNALGSYRNSPFVTGSDRFKDGLKTEILDYKAQKWSRGEDYPFSNSNRLEAKLFFHHIFDSLFPTHSIFQHIFLRNYSYRRECLHNKWSYSRRTKKNFRHCTI